MKYWFELLFKNYIDELVDQRFKENMIERYWVQKQNETARRLAKARERHAINKSTSKEDHKVLKNHGVFPPETFDAASGISGSSLKDKLKGLNNVK